MPKTYPKSTLYFFFRKKKSYLSNNKKPDYQWDLLSAAEADKAHEIVDILNKYENYYSFDEKHVDEAIDLIEESLSQQNIKTKTLKISLQEINGLVLISSGI